MPKVQKEKKFREHKEIQKQGIRFNKDFGQHILKNPMIVTNMIDKVYFNLKKSNKIFNLNLN